MSLVELLIAGYAFGAGLGFLWFFYLLSKFQRYWGLDDFRSNLFMAALFGLLWLIAWPIRLFSIQIKLRKIS